jgi:hypothetical protein
MRQRGGETKIKEEKRRQRQRQKKIRDEKREEKSGRQETGKAQEKIMGTRTLGDIGR